MDGTPARTDVNSDDARYRFRYPARLSLTIALATTSTLGSFDWHRHDWLMSEEVELAAKISGEVVSALVKESGILGVTREYSNYIVTRIHLRHQVALVQRTLAAAEKIKASGLPTRAFSALDEPLLTAILEGAVEETDPDLRQAWENLLANFSRWRRCATCFSEDSG
jgi:hypothetical protein